MSDTKRDVRVYLSHSYRPKDRPINLAILRRFANVGLYFEVDPPSRRETPDGKLRSMDVTFLEHMMRRSGGFLAIVPDRSSEEQHESWSPYQTFEYGLSIRSGKPRLIIAERDIEAGPLVPEDRERLLSFDRESGEITGGSEAEIDERIEEFVARSRAYAPDHRQKYRLPPAVLRCDPPEARYDKVRSEIRLLGKSKTSEFELEDIEVVLDAPPEDFRLMGAVEAMGVLVADLRAAFTPLHVLGYIHGRGIPWLRTCWVGKDEDKAGLKASLALANGKGLEGPGVPPPMLAGYQIDKDMEPVLFWKNGKETELAACIVERIFEHRGRERILERVRDVQKYLLSLGGNKVFVSNANSQNELAVALANELKERAYPCFQYEAQERPPGELEAELRGQIGSSDLFLALVDADYWHSSFCRFELALAVERWEQHEMRFLIYNGDDPERIPNFLARDLFFKLPEESRDLAGMAEHVRQCFEQSPNVQLMEAESTRLTKLLEAHFPGDPLGSLAKHGGLEDEEVEDLRSELEDDKPTLEQLVPALVGQVSVDPRRRLVLANLLSTASLRVAPDDRVFLREVIVRHRLYPGVFQFPRWERLLERNEAIWSPPAGDATLLKTVTQLVPDSPNWLSAIETTGASLGENPEFGDDVRARLDEPDGRLCIEGTLDQLAVPYEWMLLPGAAEPLGRWRPVRRRVTGLGNNAAPRSLDHALARGEIPPPRALVFGYGTPGIAKVDLELEEVERLLRKRYKELCWPAALLTLIPSSQATPAELERLLRTGDYQLLHLSGHAGFEEDRPFLQLHPEPGQGDESGRVHGEDLRDWTQGGDLRFVFLSVCSGALGDPAQKPVLGQFRTLCGELLEAGVPEVLSHLWPIADDQGRQLAHDFYTAYLSAPHAYDAASALRVARHARPHTEAVWASPLLVNQCTDKAGRLPVLAEHVDGG